MRGILVVLALTISGAHASEFESRYYTSVFSGDLSWVADAAPESAAGRALKARFTERFVHGNIGSVLEELDDATVRAIVARYFDYWRQVLMAPREIDSAEARLQTDLAHLVGADDVADNAEAVEDAVVATFQEHGIHYRGGRTRPLLDLMLWRNTRTVQYDVELTDTRQSVTVHFLDDFIVRGWAYFATFGRSGTGGWADRDALYCISAAYDLESEQFENSYLRHEARHFADYARFPELDGADLEYRGKLTEVAFSSGAAGLLQGFWGQADGNSQAPHPLANWRVVTDVARTIDAACTESPPSCISSASNEALQLAARRLLEENSDRLAQRYVPDAK